jgi:hypothetical protein
MGTKVRFCWYFSERIMASIGKAYCNAAIAWVQVGGLAKHAPQIREFIAGSKHNGQWLAGNCGKLSWQARQRSPVQDAEHNRQSFCSRYCVIFNRLFKKFERKFDNRSLILDDSEHTIIERAESFNCKLWWNPA